MRQRHWLELIKDYDCDILYHPDKGNAVVDALSRYPQVRLARIQVLEWEMMSQVYDWKPMLNVGNVNAMVVSRKMIPQLVVDIMRFQYQDPKLLRIKEKVLTGKSLDFYLVGGVLYFKN